LPADERRDQKDGRADVQADNRGGEETVEAQAFEAMPSSSDGIVVEEAVDLEATATASQAVEEIVIETEVWAAELEPPTQVRAELSLDIPAEQDGETAHSPALAAPVLEWEPTPAAPEPVAVKTAPATPATPAPVAAKTPAPASAAAPPAVELDDDLD